MYFNQEKFGVAAQANDGPVDPVARVRQFMGYQTRVRRFIRLLVGDDDVADDLTQEVGLTVFRHPTGPANPSSFYAWCLGLARHSAAHYWRSEGRRCSGMADAAEAFYEACSGGADPEKSCELRQALDACMAPLEASARELVLRRYLLGETALEVAESLHQTPAAVRMRLMRLRTQIRQSSTERT